MERAVSGVFVTAPHSQQAIDLPPIVSEMAARGIRVDPSLLRLRVRAARKSLSASSDPEDKRRLEELGAYVPLILRHADEGQRVVARWERAECGRYYASEPALQTVTRKHGIRDAFVPEQGFVFVDVDWRGCHVLIAAGLSQDPGLLDDVSTGRAYDVAAEVFAPELGRTEGRKAAKLCALAALNGAGAGKDGVAAILHRFGVQIPPEKGVQRRDAWLARYPRLATHSCLRERPWLRIEGVMLVRALELATPWPAVLAMHDGALFEVPDDIPDQASNTILSAFAGAAIEVLDLPDTIEPEALATVSVRSSWSGVGPETKTSKAPAFISLEEVSMKPINWCWRHRIPFGGISVFDGDPGLGKSTFCFDLLARASRGELPVGPGSDPGPHCSLILSAEDSLEYTIAPRLFAARATRSRICAVPQSTVGSFPSDTETLARIVEETNARIVLIDPLMAYLEADSHKDGDVRRALAPLAELADRRNLAIIVIRHLTKAQDRPALYRGGGSIGIIGAARAGHIIGRHPENPERLVCAPTKSNLGPPVRALEFRLVPPLDPGGACAIEHIGDCDVTADDLSAPSSSRGDESKVAEAVEWLRGVLDGAELPSKEIRRRATEDGFSWRTIERAKGQLGVKADRTAKGWFWRLGAT